MSDRIDIKRKNQKFSRRVFLLFCMQAVLHSVLGINIYKLQIQSGSKYNVLADKNRIRVSILPPPRGFIVDSKNEILVTNAFSYDVLLDNNMLDHIDVVLTELNYLCDPSILIFKDEQMMLAKAQEAKRKNASLLICKNVQWNDITKIESNVKINGIVRISHEYKRQYIYGASLGHITGYVGMPSKYELEKSSIPNYNDFMVGRNGIENSCNEQLQGVPGVQKVEVDALNRVVREISNKSSIQGDSVALSIDMSLQQKIIDITSDNKGIYVVLNIITGEVLAMHSQTGYDPNFFTSSIKRDAWNSIINNPEKPLINKSISANYPPGSIFKIVTLLSILKRGLQNETIFCSGEYKIGNRIFHCWKKGGHGSVNIYNALQCSCNIYFATQGIKVGIENIAAMARNIGLGDKTGIELPYEVGGLIPDKAWKYNRYKKPWTIGDTVNVTIGQGYVLTTPIQLIVMAARIASGLMVVPTILRNVQNNISFERIHGVSDAHLQVVRKCMYDVMCKRHDDGLEIAGKTSTAQVISRRDAKGKFKDHAMFAGFAPYHTPKYAVVSIVENAGWGADTALPITQKIFQTLFD